MSMSEVQYYLIFLSFRIFGTTVPF